ncbi:succinylglutamate desuccinylase/aspartoacylase family protein [Danxiaibacter flavus]|uniref:Succinylglutamate desuccinylase/aspartoacylase family protein n=1 Tax=Danxiaibacter flavus TaxID=3049108 RepID=A0ABV3Z9D0_9BACT|nr:succinylglutamate desuccinylase/aspartoacylase family protein [Chitinophagaceae bacterium DXS]
MKPFPYLTVIVIAVCLFFASATYANDSLSSFNNYKIAFVEKALAHKTTLGISKNGKAIEGFYFPGKTGKKALVIAGVHGSELSGIEVARQLVNELMQDTVRDYSTLVIPCLFVDNALMAMGAPAQIGSVKNLGRYTASGAVDPNRQMPSPGKAYNPATGLDHLHRSIEKENGLLLQIIAAFKPDRIVSIHAIRDTSRAGIYADPRTDARGYALGFERDSTLAIKMAAHISANGGVVPGNLLTLRTNAKYPSDPAIANAGEKQPRASCGSSLPGNVGCGISLGTWATTAVVDDDDPTNNRDAITLITMEFPGSKRTVDYDIAADVEACKKNVHAYAGCIKEVFLKN